MTVPRAHTLSIKACPCGPSCELVNIELLDDVGNVLAMAQLGPDQVSAVAAHLIQAAADVENRLELGSMPVAGHA